MNKYINVILGVFKCTLGIVAATMLLKNDNGEPLFTPSYLIIYSSVFIMTGILSITDYMFQYPTRINKTINNISSLVLFFAGIISLIDIFRYFKGYNAMPIKVSVFLCIMFLTLGMQTLLNGEHNNSGDGV